VLSLHKTYRRLRNHFAQTRWPFLFTRLNWKLILVPLQIVLILGCTVCSKCTIGSEIVLDAPDSTPGYEAQLDAHFGPFGDGVSIGAR
jgi:hypothetical protein